MGGLPQRTLEDGCGDKGGLLIERRVDLDAGVGDGGDGGFEFIGGEGGEAELLAKEEVAVVVDTDFDPIQFVVELQEFELKVAGQMEAGLGAEDGADDNHVVFDADEQDAGEAVTAGDGLEFGDLPNATGGEGLDADVGMIEGGLHFGRAVLREGGKGEGQGEEQKLCEFHASKVSHGRWRGAWRIAVQGSGRAP